MEVHGEGCFGFQNTKKQVPLCRMCPGDQRLGPWARGCFGNRLAVCQAQCTYLTQASEHALLSPSYRWGARGPRRLGHSPQVSQNPSTVGSSRPQILTEKLHSLNKCPGNESRERPCWKLKFPSLRAQVLGLRSCVSEFFWSTGTGVFI